MLAGKKCPSGHYMNYSTVRGIYCARCEAIFKRDVCSHIGYPLKREFGSQHRYNCGNCGTLLVDTFTGMDIREDKDEEIF
jgi:hypothetical protein